MTAELACLCAFIGYARLCALYARRFGRPFGVAVAAFAAGTALLAAVLSPPFDRLADGRFAWHMVQHVAIASIVAPLLVLGAPHRLALATFPAVAARRAAHWLHSRPLLAATSPLTGLAALTAVMYGTHFSPLYEAALKNDGVHTIEHAAFLGAALLFWWSMLGIAPAPSAPPHAVRLFCLFLTVPQSAFLGLAIYASTHPLYAHYVAALGSRAALEDQHVAGAIMWIAPNAVTFAVSLLLVADWGRVERRLGATADRFAAAREGM